MIWIFYLVGVVIAILLEYKVFYYDWDEGVSLLDAIKILIWAGFSWLVVMFLLGLIICEVLPDLGISDFLSSKYIIKPPRRETDDN